MESMESMIQQATSRRSPERPRPTAAQQRAQAPARPKGQAELADERKKKEVEDKEAKEEEELEQWCEQWCGRACRIGIFVPLFFSYVLFPIGEFAMRPEIPVDRSISLDGSHAVVTGGCSGIGLYTAELLAEAGAAVILACRDERSLDASRALRQVQAAADRWMGGSRHAPVVWSLKLDDFAAVRAFVERYNSQFNELQLLINNAGTRQACNVTRDGIETAFQTNYLGHFLLTKLLLPAIQRGSPSRIVHVTCRDGYLREALGWSHWFRDGWLIGWLGLSTPITAGVRVGSTKVEPRVSQWDADDDGVVGHAGDDDDADAADAFDSAAAPGGGEPWTRDCKPDAAYANSKLALLTFSVELERRLRSSLESDGIVSQAVNPNVVATDFVTKGAPPSPQRQTVMAYFPPAWIARKVFGFFHIKMTAAFTRPVEHGGKAVFHVAVAPALAGNGGGLFDDTESKFAACGRPEHLCGRVPRAWLPAVARDSVASTRLWELSESLVR